MKSRIVLIGEESLMYFNYCYMKRLNSQMRMTFHLYEIPFLFNSLLLDVMFIMSDKNTTKNLSYVKVLFIHFWTVSN